MRRNQQSKDLILACSMFKTFLTILHLDFCDINLKIHVSIMNPANNKTIFSKSKGYLFKFKFGAIFNFKPVERWYFVVNSLQIVLFYILKQIVLFFFLQPLIFNISILYYYNNSTFIPIHRLLTSILNYQNKFDLSTIFFLV